MGYTRKMLARKKKYKLANDKQTGRLVNGQAGGTYVYT